MKINTLKFYKVSFVCFFILGLIVIISSIIFTIDHCVGAGVDDLIMLFIGIPAGLAIVIFPWIINYKQLIYVVFDKTTCTSYSLFKKKLCQIDFEKPIYYFIFNVTFSYAPSVKFVSISNMPFICEPKAKSIVKKKFYGNYDTKKIIIFPYDDNIAKRLVQSGDGSVIDNQKE